MKIDSLLVLKISQYNVLVKLSINHFILNNRDKHFAFLDCKVCKNNFSVIFQSSQYEIGLIGNLNDIH